MAKVKPEYYQTSYQRLYSFLKNNHPEILQEFNEKMSDAIEKAQAAVTLGKEDE
jgi:excinuclease UvrABC nuclease subunit